MTRKHILITWFTLLIIFIFIDLVFIPVDLISFYAIPCLLMTLLGAGSYLHTKLFTKEDKSKYGGYFWWGMLGLFIISLIGGLHQYYTPGLCC